MVELDGDQEQKRATSTWNWKVRMKVAARSGNTEEPHRYKPLH